MGLILIPQWAVSLDEKVVTPYDWNRSIWIRFREYIDFHDGFKGIYPKQTNKYGRRTK